MKFLHIADLHLGKIMNEVRLAEEDQKHWRDEFLKIVGSTGAETVLIAGDVYDRGSPPDEAYGLFDSLLCALSDMGVKVFAISGNHDSGQKIGFAGQVLAKENIYIAGVPRKDIMHITLEDEYGPLTVWAVPYIFPRTVNHLLGRDDLRDYDTAFRELLREQDIDFSQRNVIIAHQNVTRNGAEAERGGSESMVAGVGGIEYTAFDGFEYAALGHIHRAQYVGREAVRYAGSPMCYHFSESGDKGAVLVEIKEKGSQPEISFIPIAPAHKVKVIRGSCAELLGILGLPEYAEAYIRAEVVGGYDHARCGSMRAAAESNKSRLLEIVPVTVRTAGSGEYTAAVDENKSITELFTDFYSYISKESTGEERTPDELEGELMTLAAEELERADMSEGGAEERIARMIIDAARKQVENK